jgi:hypothetical protein
MNSDLINEPKSEKSYQDMIHYLGVGIYLWLTIMGFSYLLKSLICKIIILNNFSPVLNFWITEIAIIVLITCSFLIEQLPPQLPTVLLRGLSNQLR